MPLGKKRRQLIVLIAAATGGRMALAAADPARKRVVFIHDSPIAEDLRIRRERWFRQEGWHVGQNLALEYVNLAELGDPQAIERKAREIITSKPDVIMIESDQVFLFRRLTKEVPLVFVNLGGDPVRLGFAQSLNRPGGNMTGTGIPLVLKAWEVAKELRPRMSRLGIVAPDDVPQVFVEEFREKYREAATRLRLQTVEIVARRDTKFAEVERAIRAARLDAVDVGIGEDVPWYRDLMKFLETDNIIGIWGDAGDVRAGGLIAVHPDFLRGSWEAARIAARILKGATPADTPVEIIELIHTSINLRTAKAMGIDVPESVRSRANMVFVK